MKQVARLQEIIKTKIPDGLIIPCHTEYEHRYKYAPTGEIYASVTGITGTIASGHLKQWAVNEGLRYLEKHWDNITPENRSEYFRAAQLAHVDTLKDAGDAGTQIHGALDRYMTEWIQTGLRPNDIKRFIQGDDIRIVAACRSAEAFFNDYYVIPIVSELKLVSPKYKYGGTMDCLAFVGHVINEGNAGRTGFAKCEHLWGESKGKVECFHCGRKLKLTLTMLDWKSSNSLDQHDDYAEQVSAYWRALFELTGIKPKELWIIRLDKQKARYEAVSVTDRKRALEAFLHTKHKYDWMRNGVTKLYPLLEKEVIKI